MKDTNIFYFGYASNLDVGTLQGRLPEEPRLLGLGVLEDHELQFNFPNADGSARANIQEKKDHQVFGLIFEISEASVAHFLKSEPGYNFVEKQVQFNSKVINAYTFQSYTKKEGLSPKKDYLNTILKGGKVQGLPEIYLNEIENKSQTS